MAESHYVAIHAPTWGATAPAGWRLSPRCCFNPRAHVGRDRHGMRDLLELLGVSIHAPTWGATLEKLNRRGGHHRVSIHAPTWGATSASARLSGF